MALGEIPVPPKRLLIVPKRNTGIVNSLCPVSRSGLWINGGFFALRPRIFGYIRRGEDLVR